MHSEGKKGRKPTAISSYNSNEVECVCILPSILVSQLAFMSCNMCLPCERCVSHHQGMPHTYNCIVLIRLSTLLLHTHTLTCTWHSFQLSGHISCMIRTIFTHYTVKFFSCLSYNGHKLDNLVDIKIPIYWNIYRFCAVSIVLLTWDTHPIFQYCLQNFVG